MGTGEILLAISVVILCVYQLSKKKKLPPGLLALLVIGHFHLIGKSPHKDLYRLARKHGPIMHLRFGFVPIIVVSSPEAAKLVPKKHDLTFANRPPFKHFYGERSMVFGTYGPYWRDMRKLSTMELLSQRKIDQFCSMRMEELVLLVNGPLKQAARVREPVDLSIKISSLGADMTCLMVFGKKYANKDMDGKGTMEAAATFNIGDYFPYIGRLDLQGLTSRMKALTNIFDGF